MIQQLAPDDLPLVSLHPDLKLATAPAALVSYLAMNTQRRPLNDPRIRRAIAHAIRRDALVKLILIKGWASRRSGRCRPTSGARAQTSSPIPTTCRVHERCWRRRGGRARAARR